MSIDWRVDMRRDMNTPVLQVEQEFGRGPHAGDLFVLRGRKGDRVTLYAPGEGRRVRRGMADDGRGVGGTVAGDHAVEPGLVDFYLAVGHVAPGTDAADVDPAAECAHGRVRAMRRMRSIDQTMRSCARPVHRTGVRCTGGVDRRALRPILLVDSSRETDKFNLTSGNIQWCQRNISHK